jgi:hypothetical protein
MFSMRSGSSMLDKRLGGRRVSRTTGSADLSEAEKVVVV